MEKPPNGSKQEVTSQPMEAEHVHNDVGATLRDCLATPLDVGSRHGERLQQQGVATNDLKHVVPRQIRSGSEEGHDISLQPKCERCREINDKYMSYKKRMELNLRIIKEKIATTDELIKKYKRKCQENDQNCKKVTELTEKIRKCYCENGTLRAELEKAKAANEPLRKTAMRLENEKKLMDTHVEGLMSKLKDTQRHLEDVQASMSATDQMSSTLHGRLKKKERDVGNLESRLQKKEKTVEKLLAQLKEAKAARRQSDIQAKKASKEIEKIRKKLPADGDVKRGRNNSKKGGTVQKVKGNRSTGRVSAPRTRSKLMQNTEDQESEMKSRENNAVNSGGANEFISTSDSGSEEDDEISAIFESSNAKLATKSNSVSTGDVLANFAIPSPPLSPIPPSPAPLRHVRKVGLDAGGEQSSGKSRVIRGKVCALKNVTDLADVNGNDDDDNDENGDGFGHNGRDGAKESENNGNNINDVSDCCSSRDEVNYSRHDLMKETRTLEEDVLDVNKDQQSSAASGSKLPDDSTEDGCIETGTSLLSPKHDSVVENDSCKESLELVSKNMTDSGKVVDNILGVVSSDESDSDVDPSGEHSDALDDEDYSSFDSCDPRYDCVNQSEDGELQNTGKNRTETESGFEAIDDSLVRSSKGTGIGDSIGLVSKSTQQPPVGASDEKHKSVDASGDSMESPEQEKIMNLSEMGRLNSEEISTVNIFKKPGLVSLEKEGVVCKQDRSNEEGLMSLTAVNTCMVDNEEEHSVLKILTNVSPMKLLHEDRPFDESCKVNKEKQKGLGRNDSEICGDFDMTCEKASKRLFDLKEEPNPALRNICKRSRRDDDIDASNVKELAGFNKTSHETSKEVIDIHFEGDTGHVTDEIMVNAKHDLLLFNSSDAEKGSVGGRDVADSSMELSETASVAAGQNEMGSCDNMLENLVETADCNENISILSEPSCEVILNEMTSEIELLPRTTSVSQAELSRERANSITEVDNSPVSAMNEGIVQGNTLTSDSNCAVSGESLDTGRKIDSMANPSDAALTEEKGWRSPDRIDIKKGQKFGAEIRPQNQTLQSHRVTTISRTISDGPSIKDLEEKSNLKGRIYGDEATRLYQNPSNDVNDDNDIISKHFPQSDVRTNVIQIEDRTEQLNPIHNRPPPFAGEHTESDLCLDSIISEETDDYPQLSPLPPSPGVQRPRSISPLPITPLPGVVSPLISPSQLASPPSLRESTIDSDRLPGIAKPRATLSSYSVRMLDFLSTDDEELELEGPSYPCGKIINKDGAPISFASSSTFAVVNIQNSDSSGKRKAFHSRSSALREDGKAPFEGMPGRSPRPVLSPIDSRYGCQTVGDNTGERKSTNEFSLSVAESVKDGNVERSLLNNNITSESPRFEKKQRGCFAGETINVMEDSDSGIGDKIVQRVSDEDVSENGKRNNVPKTEQGASEDHKNSCNKIPTKLSLRKRKIVETCVGRSLRSSDKHLGNRNGTSVDVQAEPAKQNRETAKRKASCRLNPTTGANMEKKSDGRRSLRSNTRIVAISKNVRRMKERNEKCSDDRIGSVKEMNGEKSQREHGNMNLDFKVEWSDNLTNRDDEVVNVENTKDKDNKSCMEVHNPTCESNNVTELCNSESSSPTRDLKSSSFALKQFIEEPGLSVRPFDNIFGKRQGLHLIAERSGDRSALETEETVKYGLPFRDRKQSEVDYAQYCIESLQDSESLRDVVRQFSLIKNISSATSIVSAIVSYYKTVKTDNLLNVYQRLHGNEANVSNSRLVRDVFVDRFTKCPEVTKKELLIAEATEECSKVPQLNAIMKRVIHFFPKAILREDRNSDESVLSLCRVFTIICRRQNEIRPLKEFLFDVSVSSSLLDILDKIVIVCFCVWPTVFIDASLPFDKPYEAIGNSVGSQAIFLSVQVLAIYQSAKREDPQIYKFLLAVFNGSPIGSDCLQWLCNALLTYLKNEELQKELEANKPGELLGPNASDIVKSFDILLMHKGWKWCNNYLVGDHLWGIFRQWSQQSPESTLNGERVHDATIVTAIRIIGRICCSAIKDGYKSFGVIVNMCCGILSKSRQISKIPQPVQLSAAYTLLDISSPDTFTIPSELSQWLQSATFDIPADLRSRIISLTCSEQF